MSKAEINAASKISRSLDGAAFRTSAGSVSCKAIVFPPQSVSETQAIDRRSEPGACLSPLSPWPLSNEVARRMWGVTLGRVWVRSVERIACDSLIKVLGSVSAVTNVLQPCRCMHEGLRRRAARFSGFFNESCSRVQYYSVISKHSRVASVSISQLHVGL